MTTADNNTATLITGPLSQRNEQTSNGTASSGYPNNNDDNDDDDDHSSSPVRYQEPFTVHQKILLEQTRSVLADANGHPAGTLSYAHIIQISNCIHQWISSGEHRYLGAEQAERLMKRLIVERGGGRSLAARTAVQGADG